MILCVGLTPTVQRTLRFDRLSLGEVNRAHEVLQTASGKGVNVARVVTLLGGDARLVQILGGDSGRWVAGTLDRERIGHQTVWTNDDAPTRTCTTLLTEDAPTTELVEEARSVEPHDAALIEAACLSALFDASALCLSGSLPPGIDAGFYARMVAKAHALGIPAVVDAQKAPLHAALAARPFLVKPNREEAAATLGFPLTGDAQTDARTAIAELTAAGAQWALVSMGRDGSLLGDSTDLWRITPPTVAVINPIGSGDALAAGTLFAHITRGMPLPDACAFGTACGAANCLTPTSGVVDAREVERLWAAVRVERV